MSKTKTDDTLSIEADWKQSSLQIVPYQGYGTPTRLHYWGRVLENHQIGKAHPDAPPWENLLNSYKRLGMAVVPNAQVRVSLADYHQQVNTNHRGFFTAEIHPTVPLPSDRIWHDVDLALLTPVDSPPSRQIGRVLVPPPQAQFGIISDIDDTIVYTYNEDLWRMLQIVYLGNAHTRIPFSGIAAFYRALQQGKSGVDHNPFFYVSSSSWNLYDLLEEFMALNGLPNGPLLLREIELTLDNLLGFTHEHHKLNHIRPILDCFPHLPFILVGDSGQRDAEIYHQLAREYGEQILAIYIRNVVPRDRNRRQRLNAIAQDVRHLGIPFVTVPDTLVAATHAARQGWIAANALPDIQTNETATRDRPGW